MAINYELERNIGVLKEAGNQRGAQFLEGMRSQFRVAVEAGIVPELPLETTVVQRAVSLQSEAKQESLGQKMPGEKSIIEELGWQDNSFSERLRILITRKGLTQLEFAEKMHLDKQTISRWVRSVTRPRLAQVLRTRDVLELSEQQATGLVILSGNLEELINNLMIEVKVAAQNSDAGKVIVLSDRITLLRKQLSFSGEVQEKPMRNSAEAGLAGLEVTRRRLQQQDVMTGGVENPSHPLAEPVKTVTVNRRMLSLTVTVVGGLKDAAEEARMREIAGNSDISIEDAAYWCKRFQIDPQAFILDPVQIEIVRKAIGPLNSAVDALARRKAERILRPWEEHSNK